MSKLAADLGELAAGAAMTPVSQPATAPSAAQILTYLVKNRKRTGDKPVQPQAVL